MPAMDPDRYQMRDLKRRMSKLEDQIGYLKTDWKRTTQKVNGILKDTCTKHCCHSEECGDRSKVHIEGRS